MTSTPFFIVVFGIFCSSTRTGFDILQLLAVTCHSHGSKIPSCYINYGIRQLFQIENIHRNFRFIMSFILTGFVFFLELSGFLLLVSYAFSWDMYYEQQFLLLLVIYILFCCILILSICCALVDHVPLQVLFILRGGPYDFWRGEWAIWYHDCFYALEDFFLGMCVCMVFWLTDHERAVVECTWIFLVQDSL